MNTHRYGYVERDYEIVTHVIKAKSHDLQSAEDIHPVQTQRLENHGSQSCKSHSESAVLRTRITDVWGPEKMDVLNHTENKFTFPSNFSSICPQRIGWYPVVWLRITFFTPFTDSNANLFQKYFHKHTKSNVLPAFWASLTLVKLTHKLTIPQTFVMEHSTFSHRAKIQFYTPSQKSY